MLPSTPLPLSTPTSIITTIMSNTPNSSQRLAVVFKQLNCAKSKAVMATLGSYMVKWSQQPLFVLLQEPATTTRGRIESLPQGTLAFADALRP